MTITPTRAAILAIVWLLQAPASHAQDDALDALFSTAELQSDTEGDATESLQVISLPAQAAPAAPNAARGRQLEEIIVTAQKTEQGLMDVPVSVSAIDGKLMREAGITDINQVQEYASNVTIKATPFVSELRIRGFGTSGTVTAQGFESSVGTVVDDVFYGRSQFLSAVLLDVEQMEILRGPQGTLFGKNTIAGVFNVRTGGPDEEFSGRVDSVFGDFNTRRITPVLNLPLADSLGLRLAAVVSEDSGYLYNTTRDHIEADQPQQGLRGKLAWSPSDTLALTLTGFHSRSQGHANLAQLSHISEESRAYFRQFDDKLDTDIRNGKLQANAESVSEIRLAGGSLKAEWDLPAPSGIQHWSLTSVSAHAAYTLPLRSLDADYSPVPVLTLQLNKPQRYRQLSQEVRLAGLAGAPFGWGRDLEFVGGLFVFRSRLSTDELLAFEDIPATLGYLAATNAQDSGAGGNPASAAFGSLGGVLLSRQELAALSAQAGGAGVQEESRLALDQTTRATAAFGQATWFVGERLAFILGLRYGTERKHGDFISASSGVLMPAILGQTPFTASVERRETDFSPKLGVMYDFDAVNTYATITRGFKGGGFNAFPLTEDNIQFEPEQATNYEIGFKAELFERTLRLTGASFLTNFDNLQVTATESTTITVRNAASARSLGFELDALWLTPWQGASLMANLGYTDATYLSYPDAPAQAASGEDSQDLGSQVLQNSPRWTASLLPSFSLALPGSRLAVRLGLDVSYKSGYYTDVDLDPGTYQPGVVIYNARIGLGPDDQHWSLNLQARNLSDEAVVMLGVDEPGAPGNFASVVRPGRALMGAFRWDF